MTSHGANEAVIDLNPVPDNWMLIRIKTSLNRAAEPSLPVSLCHGKFGDFETVFFVIHTLMQQTPQTTLNLKKTEIRCYPPL
jgi:hypothetical protein